MIKLSLVPILVLILFPLRGVGCDNEGDLSPPANLDPNATPIPTGDWYKPEADVSWQIQLQGELVTSYDVSLFEIDLFDTSPQTITALKAQGFTVSCYFSAGSGEDWRDDYDQFLDTDLGNNLAGWPGEKWLDVRSANVVEIMISRLDLAAEKGCMAVELDNVDGYTNQTGFDLNYADQLAFNRHFSNAAHQRGLAIALKNDLEQIDDLLAYYDLILNESCHEWNECNLMQPFVTSGKPVLNIEYPSNEAGAQTLAEEICPSSKIMGLRTLILPLALDGSFRIDCDDI